MSLSNQFESQIRKLSRNIIRLDDEVARSKREHSMLSKSVARLRRQLTYLQFLRWFRSQVKSFELWPIGVLTVVPAITGSLLLILLGLLNNSFSIVSFVVGAVIGLGVFSAFLYLPNSHKLDTTITDAEYRLHIEKTALAAISKELEGVERKLGERMKQREELLASVGYKRERLLQRNWKAMRGTEWEEYLAEVCRALGGTVELTGNVGDQGVDLVVEFGNRRIAVQAKGYHNSVSNAAVRQAVAGMAHYRCTGCAVLTNSRFTKSAEELAISNDCTLVGEEEFPAFVRGDMVL